MWNIIRSHLLYAGIDREDYLSVETELRRSNRSTVQVFSIVAAAVLCALFVCSFVVDGIRDFRWLYFTFALTMIPVMMVCTSLYKTHGKLLMPATYLFVVEYYAFAIILGTVSSPNELASSFIALLLTLSLVLTDRPIRMVMVTFAAVAAFVVMAVLTKSGAILQTDVINAVVFGILGSVVSVFTVKIKAERYVFERKAIILSEIDVLTGLKNRNSFERNLTVYPDMCESSLGCVYIDVNGLHELNNAKGHEAGDIMLQTIARQVRDVFGPDHAYRIGGDEYVIFLLDETQSRLLQKAEELKNLVLQTDYHISVGSNFADRETLNVNTLIRNAEVDMYEAKAKYYRDAGIERRRTTRV